MAHKSDKLTSENISGPHGGQVTDHKAGILVARRLSDPGDSRQQGARGLLLALVGYLWEERAVFRFPSVHIAAKNYRSVWEVKTHLSLLGCVKEESSVSRSSGAG